ncbi:MAG: nitroreductase [Bacteroidales bacterium]|nr:nitroreductase [Bacteroidales bacterium]
MNIYDLIKQRESVRDYDPERIVEKEKLMRILNAGRLAPSAANKQPWRFLLVSSPTMLEKVRECYHKPWFRRAPHILIITGNENESWKRSFDGYNSIETDLTIAMDHIILAAEYEGVGTCWIAAFDPYILQEALELGDNEKVFAITPLGYPGSGYQRKEAKNSGRDLEEIR